MSKFSQGLVARAKEEEKNRAIQKHLQEKYQVDTDQDVLIVEKSSLAKYLLHLGVMLIRLMAGSILFLLALIGLAALIYPDTRSGLVYQGYLTLSQLKSLF
ncbi:MAG: hypothetical protein K2J67_10830 [Lachnospiraceae bacterium]|nr:hypothetical protein [Lachnospiraceae bacterium]